MDGKTNKHFKQIVGILLALPAVFLPCALSDALPLPSALLYKPLSPDPARSFLVPATASRRTLINLLFGTPREAPVPSFAGRRSLEELSHFGPGARTLPVPPGRLSRRFSGRWQRSAIAPPRQSAARAGIGSGSWRSVSCELRLQDTSRFRVLLLPEEGCSRFSESHLRDDRHLLWTIAGPLLKTGRRLSSSPAGFGYTSGFGAARIKSGRSALGGGSAPPSLRRDKIQQYILGKVHGWDGGLFLMQRCKALF
ncbi:uncharacterized protein LOC130248609 isoform X2 [Oenanthe melanoleuca]|uniref:uncharacterized protein LOC130248609 isoform X2 n=1 Tax=Oenanthe melanoleuca TaxID=2939378 RepID=UPI0024C1B345|nr:uncharacterized protein LOC130248609 isoform X2 [Oenanthe melanoleuca]